MARKNSVTLTFAGDSSDLERSFDRVGSGAKGMGDDVKSGFDRVGESADNLDTRAMGFRDTLTGVEDTSKGLSEIMKGNLFDGVLLLGMGFGDLASGVANFGVQFVKTAGQFIVNHARMLAVHMANAARMAVGWLIAMGPIALVIVAIAAIIGILVALGVDFEDVKNAIAAGWEWIKDAAASVFNWLKENWPLVLAIITGPIGIAVLLIVKHWDTIKEKVGAVLGFIKDGVTGAKNWIVARFNDVVSFVTGLPGRIATAASGMWDGIKTAFKSAVNAIIGWWNGLSLTLPTIDVPGWDPPGPGPKFGGFSIGGQTFSTPNIPYLHTGGTFRAPSGQREGLAMLLDGEKVTRPGAPSPGEGMTVTVYVQGSIRSDRDLVQLIRDEFQRGGFGGVAT